MKIIKILFLGIVLVLFNLAYLAAQTLPDSVTSTWSSAEPGGELMLTVDVRFHSTSPGGIILIGQGLPAGLVTTADGINLATGSKPTAAGTWSYEWTTGYGKVISSQALEASVAIDPEGGTVSLIILGSNIDFLRLIPPPTGIDPAAVGSIVNVYINVPANFAEGTYEIELADEGLQIGKYPVGDGFFEGLPYFSGNSISIAEIPDFNAIEMDAANLSAASGGSASVSLNIANKDTVGSGSFVIGYNGAILTLTSVEAGVRAGGATFNLVVSDSSTALAADGKFATIGFTGATIGIGGAGELCKLNFSVAQVGAGVAASVLLGSVDLNAPGGGDVPDLQQPTTAATAIEFSFGDTLSLGNMLGEGTAIIIDGQLHVPIVLKNASSVSAVRFYISEPAGQEDILSLSEDIIMHANRAAGWMVSAADSGSYVQVIAYAPTASAAIAAGSGQLFHVVFDIHNTAFTVPSPGSTVNLTLGLAGVELTSSAGTMLGVEAVGGVASLDYRVPNDGEGVSPGASLPKAFSLAQNHPNPFNPSTTINYQIPDQVGSVSFQLNVYDLRGKLVRTLDKGLKGAGTYSVYWDGTDDHGRQVSSGVYFYRFTSSEFNATRKMVMVK